MGSVLLSLLLFSGRHCSSSSLPMAHLSVALICMRPHFKLALLPCTPFEFRCRISFSWLGLWKYPLGIRLLVVFCRFLGQCLPVRCRCHHMLVEARTWLWLLAGSDICVLKIPSGALVYFCFLGSKLYGTDSVTMMYLSSSLSWCDFPTFFFRWEWFASRPHGWSGRTGGRRNHVAHTYVKKMILLTPPLVWVVGLVGDLCGEGSNTIVAREIFYMSHTIPIRSGLWKLGLISWKYSVCGHRVARVGISYHIFYNFFEFLWTLVIQ